MKRGKPHKQETQILVGELRQGNKNLVWDRKIDKCLSLERVQNMAYKIFLFFYIYSYELEVSILKEIGEKLKQVRESIGVSIEEAATDLKMTVKQLENLENGDMEAYKDVINVKYLIRDYAKYLGLDKEDLVDDFNEYLFDYTSKISIEDIKNAKEKASDTKTPKIRSPYTIIKERKTLSFPIVMLIIIICLVTVVGFIYYKSINKKTDNIIAYAEVIK